MRRLILAAALALAACGDGPGQEPRAAQMTSIVAFDPAQFAGSWTEVAAIGRPAGGRWQVRSGSGGTVAVTTSRDGAGQGRLIGPGRMQLSSFKAPLWVLWADRAMRTVVLGTPDRSFASVLDRSPTIPGDRLEAARRVLAWNGYDIERLQ